MLIWSDAGYLARTDLPDFCVVLDSEYEVGEVAGIQGHGEIHCTRHPDEHQWDYPGSYGDRPFELLATSTGARCPECGGQLVVSFMFGENGYMDSAEIPWNGDEPCECGHRDHFGRVCNEMQTSRRDKPCECTWPYETAEEIPPMPRVECGQLALGSV